MIKIFKNRSRAICLCCVGLLCIVSSAFSQTTYKIERTLTVKQVYKFAHDLGIKANAAGGKVEVRMYARDCYTSGGRGDKNSLLYGAYSITDSTTGYIANPWDITYTDLCYVSVLNQGYWCPSGTPKATSIIRPSSGKYRGNPEVSTSRINNIAEKLSLLPLESSNSQTTFQVIIELDVNGSTTLDKVYNIKLPGVADIAGLEFDSNVKNYSNPCPSAAGCDAVADFKNVSDDANKKPIVIAHRGYHGMRGVPENSLAAVQKAYNEGFRYTEVDLRMTKDYVPFTFHDDYLGYVTNFSTLNDTSSSTYTEERTWSEISSLKYQDRYWDKAYKTAVNSSGNTVQVRLGSVTATSMSSFDAIADYIKGKDIMVYLDIKSAPMVRNFEVMKQCILIAAQKNVLHQVAFKMVRTNRPPDDIHALNMTVSAAKKNLGWVYTAFKNYINIHVVDYNPVGPASFITDWIAEGNVVGFEFDIASTPLFEAGCLKPHASLGTEMSPWQYSKSRGYRTGIFCAGPLDPRGRPGGYDPSVWNTGKAMVNDITTWQHYTDNRARSEVFSLIAPQYVTHDRPDEMYNYLSAVVKINTNTKR